MSEMATKLEDDGEHPTEGETHSKHDWTARAGYGDAKIPLSIDESTMSIAVRFGRMKLR